MKQVIKDEIDKLYGLFKTPPKLNVENTKQHIHTFADNPTNYKANYSITGLRSAVNSIRSVGKCSWCGASTKKVQESLPDIGDLKPSQIKIKKLADKGYSFRKIEKKLGCSKGAISYHLSKGQKEKALARQKAYKATFQLPRAVYLASVIRKEVYQ